MHEQKIKYGSNSFGESRLKIQIFQKFHFWPFFLIAISRFSWFTSFSNRMSVTDMVSFEIFFHVTNSGELGCSNVWTKSKIQVERVRREQFENKIFPHILAIFWQKFRNFYDLPHFPTQCASWIWSLLKFFSTSQIAES